MFCPKCGKKNIDSAIYCDECGGKLPKEKNEKNAAIGRYKGLQYALIGILLLIVLFINIMFLNQRESQVSDEKMLEEIGNNTEDKENEIKLEQEKVETIEENKQEIVIIGDEQEKEEKADEVVGLGEVIISPETKAIYGNNLDTSEYFFYNGETDFFNFYYPPMLYNKAEVNKKEEEYFEGSNIVLISFYGDDNSSKAEFQLLTNNGDMGIREKTMQIYEHYENILVDAQKIAYTDNADSHGRFVITGYTDISQSVLVYLLVSIYEQNIQKMRIEFPGGIDKESVDFLEKSYVVECMYRMCGFSNSSYRPRTFEQFIAGEPGEKY